MSARVIWVAAAVLALLVGATAGGPSELQLSVLGQGVTPVDASVGRLYAMREGSVVYAASATTARGARVVWCPYEELFWSPESLAVYSRSGRVEYQGKRPGDALRFFRVAVDGDQVVRIFADGKAERPPARTIARDVMSFYVRWLNRENIPTDKELRWCPSPVR